VNEVKLAGTFVVPEAELRKATLSFTGKSSPAKLKLFRRADVTDTSAALFVDLTFELRDPASGAELFKSGKVRVTEQTRLLFAIVRNTGPGPASVQLVGLDGYSMPVEEALE
jgi:hypothetical protein